MLKDFESQFLEFIEDEMQQDLAHDLNHIHRVVSTAKKLCEKENAIAEIVVPASYLHDCFILPKNHPNRAQSSKLSADKATAFLKNIQYPDEFIEKIHHAIVAHSYSAGVIPETLEAQIVQDADRLDAIGAVGIARSIQVATMLNVQLYNSADPLADNRALDDKKYCIDHFYIKLLKLAEKMNTHSAKIEAEHRTNFMKLYIQQLLEEI